MRKASLLLSSLIVFTFLSITATSILAAGPTDDSAIIKQKMGELGFEVGEIIKAADRAYLVNITGFREKMKGVTLTKQFKSLTVKVSVIDIGGSQEKAGVIGDIGVVIRDKAKIENAGFMINPSRLPKDIRIE